MMAMKRVVMLLGAALVAAQGRGADEFAWKLHAAVARGREGNVVCSPYGVAEALGMLEAGAAGRTAGELRGAIVPEGVADVAGYFAGKHGDWVSLGRGGGGGVEIANSVWIRAGGGGVAEETARVLREAYGAEAQEADFGNGAETARRINEWVAGATHGKIPRLFGDGAFGEGTEGVLCNAVWFAGRWASPFGTEATAPGTFHAAGGDEVEVPMMHRRLTVRLAEREEGAMLCLPYAGDELEFRAWLPAEGRSLEELEARLAEGAEAWEEWESALARGPVEVSLPRFRVEWGPEELSAALGELGVREAFGAGAELPGFGGGRVSRVVQAATIEVDEEGTVATAATAVHLARGMARPRPARVFRADRPFLFAVVERAMGCVLFTGRLARPAGTIVNAAGDGDDAGDEDVDGAPDDAGSAVGNETSEAEE